MLAGLAGRPFGSGCGVCRPLASFPFMAGELPLVGGSRLSEGAGGVDEVDCAWAKEERALASEAYAGIICDSWMVTLIKEAGLAERCVGGVDEA